SPFLYFADFDADLAAAVRKGRGEFLAQFEGIRDIASHGGGLGDPRAVDKFRRSGVDCGGRVGRAAAYALQRDLLRLRREDTVFRAAGRTGIDGAVLTERTFLLRYFSRDHADDRLVIVNLGRDFSASSVAEPLTAPPPGLEWAVRWSSEDATYG